MTSEVVDGSDRSFVPFHFVVDVLEAAVYVLYLLYAYRETLFFEFHQYLLQGLGLLGRACYVIGLERVSHVIDLLLDVLYFSALSNGRVNLKFSY